MGSFLENNLKRMLLGGCWWTFFALFSLFCRFYVFHGVFTVVYRCFNGVGYSKKSRRRWWSCDDEFPGAFSACRSLMRGRPLSTWKEALESSSLENFSSIFT